MGFFFTTLRSQKLPIEIITNAINRVPYIDPNINAMASPEARIEHDAQIEYKNQLVQEILAELATSNPPAKFDQKRFAWALGIWVFILLICIGTAFFPQLKDLYTILVGLVGTSATTIIGVLIGEAIQK